MPPLQVKDCPTEVYERLRQCAAEENRSISQQTLTIIEYFLDARDAGLLNMHESHTSYVSAPSPNRMHDISPARSQYSSYAGPEERAQIAGARAALIERIKARNPIPVSEDRLPADRVIRQMREECDEQIWNNLSFSKAQTKSGVVLRRRNPETGEIIERRVAQ